MGKITKVSLFMLILAFVLAVSACSESNTNGKQADGPKNQNSNESNEGSELPSGEESGEGSGEGEYDLKGRTIKIAGWWDGVPKPDTEEGEKALARWKAVEEKYKVKLEFSNIAFEEYQQQFTAGGLAGKPIGDIVYMSQDWIPAAIQGNLLNPLDEWIDKDYWDKEMVNWAGYQGTIYGMATTPINGRGIFYNKTLIQNEGLTDPFELQQKGEWTWSKFLEYAKQLTKDKDGDGKIDQYGYYGVWYMMGEDFISSNNGDIIAEKDGKFVSGWDQPNAMEGLRFLYDLVNVHKVVSPIPPEQRNEEFNSGKIAMKQSATNEGAQAMSVLGNQFGFVKVPKGPQAEDYISMDAGPAIATVPAGVENPEIMVKIYEELGAPRSEWMDGIRGYLETVLVSPAEIDSVIDSAGKFKLNNYLGIQGARVSFIDAMGDIVMGGVTPEVAVEQRKLAMQSAIDEVFNK